MEEQSLNIPKTFVYDTLSPLALSAADSPFPDNGESYSVFRNEISVDTPQRASPSTTTVDFFSLDVASEAYGGVSLPQPLAAVPEPKTPTPVPEAKLESVWFGGNGKFKSPMLQLHKGKTFISAFSLRRNSLILIEEQLKRHIGNYIYLVLCRTG